VFWQIAGDLMSLIVLKWQWRVSKPLTLCTNILL